jgi:iron complex transport system substrate-binding protein
VPGSGWHDMIVLGGGANIFGDVVFANQTGAVGSVHDFQVDAETVIARDPEAIIMLGAGGTNYPAPSMETLRAQAEEILNRPGWQGVAAIRDREVHVIGFFAANIVSKIIASVYVAKALYPDRFADVDPEALVRRWLEEFQGVPYTAPYSFSLQ